MKLRKTFLFLALLSALGTTSCRAYQKPGPLLPSVEPAKPVETDTTIVKDASITEVKYEDGLMKFKSVDGDFFAKKGEESKIEFSVNWLGCTQYTRIFAYSQDTEILADSAITVSYTYSTDSEGNKKYVKGGTININPSSLSDKTGSVLVVLHAEGTSSSQHGTLALNVFVA